MNLLSSARAAGTLSACLILPNPAVAAGQDHKKLMIGHIDEQEKSGDDDAARVYVMVSGGLAFWRTRAINYVWASTSPKGRIWPNAFAGDHAVMIALRSADDQTGVWHIEKRNILADLKQQFGEDIQYIDAVAIMADTDNAQGKATAYYGDIYFSKE